MPRPGRKLQSAALEKKRAEIAFDMLLPSLSFAQQRVMSPGNRMNARLERAHVRESG